MNRGKKHKFFNLGFILRIPLIPFSLLYLAIVTTRNVLYDLGFFSSKTFSVPVICVGNLTTGGTGKTPHVEFLVNFLKSRFNLAVLSRGYLRKSKGFILSDMNSTVSEIGDEPKQMKMSYPDVVFAVDRDRAHGIEKLTNHNKANLVILDDGFQHRKVTPKISIVLIDFNKPLFNDFILPLGNLREHKSGISRAKVIIVSKCPPNINDEEKQFFIKKLKLKSEIRIFFSSFEYKGFVSLENNANKVIPLHDFRQKFNNVVLVTGIANPNPLKEYLSDNFTISSHLQYTDHYRFKAADLKIFMNKMKSSQENQKVIVTTQKDAVRLLETLGMTDELRKMIYYIPISVYFPFENEERDFQEFLLSLLSH